jgi:hypothetical protein
VKVERNSSIAGRPIREVRDFLRATGQGRFGRARVIELLGQPDATDALIEAGFIRRLDDGDIFEETDIGIQLRSTNLVPRITRKKADSIMAAFMQRVVNVNATPELICSVAEVHVFGSYITDAPEVGDIDLSVVLKLKADEGTWTERSHARAAATGRRMSFIDSSAYGATEVMLILKARSPYLVFVHISVLEKLGCPRELRFRLPETAEA